MAFIDPQIDFRRTQQLTGRNFSEINFAAFHNSWSWPFELVRRDDFPFFSKGIFRTQLTY
ncbi:hypothetical protein LX99_05032 [Mucilaginibacter oryzae]|uniref:Uncharacterized protein n=1 Tax=Mucilaginibacter oryzae TaxID=468058 RepID=A0A316GS33_9SPHI|nr:hypothetical protein LX99_05032 [Mucilaginibacter oryzae]